MKKKVKMPREMKKVTKRRKKKKNPVTKSLQKKKKKLYKRYSFFQNINEPH